MTLLLVVLFYASRALEEILLEPRFSPLVFGLSLVVAHIYLLATIRVFRQPAADLG